MSEESANQPASGEAGAAPEAEPGAAKRPDPRDAAKRRAPRDAAGMDRPRFLLDFPEDPELERLISAFERGNYRLIRTDAEQLARTTTDPAVREAALELRRRIDPDPLAKYFLGVAVMLLLFLVVWTYRMQAR